MLNIEPHKVMVCVSPGEDCEAGLEFAVAQARSRGCGIHLAMVLRPILVGLTDVADVRLADGTLRNYGTDFLIECEQKVHKLSDGAVSVSTEIIHGAVVPALIEESKNAGLVVMQHHRMHRQHHLPTLSVTNGVAARAHAPVVAVPMTGAKGRSPGSIAVGVEDAVSSHQVVRAAFEEAQRIGAECTWCGPGSSPRRSTATSSPERPGGCRTQRSRKRFGAPSLPSRASSPTSSTSSWPSMARHLTYSSRNLSSRISSWDDTTRCCHWVRTWARHPHCPEPLRLPGPGCDPRT